MPEQLDPPAVRAWCRAAAQDLDRVRAELNAMNVFPVADSDTGTNMQQTMVAVAHAADGAGDAQLWAAIAHAALLEARGNSGALLGQLLHGFAEVAPLDGAGLASALRRAADLAYDAMGAPVEGTILTVARAAADAVTGGASLPAVAAAATQAARDALARTPGQLSVLADAGVVDAGAAGLVVVLDALARACGATTDDLASLPLAAPRHGTHASAPREPAYEVMYLLDAGEGAVAALREDLAGLGESLVVAGGGQNEPWSVHVHTADPGAAVEAGLGAGRPHRLRLTAIAASGSGRAVLALSRGPRLGAVFEGAGAAVLQLAQYPAEPLADALRAAVLATGAAEVIVLPNRDDLLADLREAAASCRDAGVRVAVLPAATPIHGLTALAVHDADRPFDDDATAMAAAAGAVRCAAIDEADDPVAAAVTRTERLVAAGDASLVTLVSGAKAPAGLVARVHARLARRWPELEIAEYEGDRVDQLLLVGAE